MESRAIRVHETGGTDVIRCETEEIGDPGPGQVLVAHEAIGVNFIDTYHRSGLYPLDLPTGLGMEAAGVVRKIGADVDEFEPGQRVAYAGGRPGAYSDTRLVKAERLVPVPDDVDSKTAAAGLLRGMTVEYLTRRLFQVREGMTVLWHAAAGGVGTIACQWLSHIGATIIGTVGTDEKAELAKEHGCDHVIRYDHEDFVHRVDEITGGRGVPVVYDSVGRDTLERSLRCLSPQGYLVAFGNASGAPPAIDPLRLADGGSLFLTRPRLFDYVGRREELLDSARTLFALVSNGVVRPIIGQEWLLEQAAEAHRALEARETIGSTILVP